MSIFLDGKCPSGIHQIGFGTNVVCGCDVDDASEVFRDASAVRIQRGCSHAPANKSMPLCNDVMLCPPPSRHKKEQMTPPLTNTFDFALACTDGVLSD